MKSSILFIICTTLIFGLAPLWDTRQTAHAENTVQALPFRQSKKKLAAIYKNKQQLSFYCGCEFNYQGKKLVPNLKACGYQVRRQAKRAQRIEWEHVMPAWAFGHQRQCWQKGGRKACRSDREFKLMEGDMHNLVPAIGEVNGDRSNYRFSAWNGRPYQYGTCNMVVDFRRKQVQPPVHTRGVIARAYLYMASTYNISLSNREQRQYHAWNNQHPPSQWECKRNGLIKKIQGNENPFISGCD